MDPLDAYMASIQEDATLQVEDLNVARSVNGLYQHVSPHLATNNASAPDIAASAVMSSKRIRNRRYRALQALLKSEYFNDDEMQRRDPSLFQDVLGVHIDAAILSESSRASMNWAEPASERLSESSRASVAVSAPPEQSPSERIGLRLGFGAGADTEDVSQASRPLTSMLVSATQRQVHTAGPVADDGEGKVSMETVVSPEDFFSLEDARSTLVRLMAERFLRGDDAAFFEYAEVDNDDNLDVHNEAIDDWEDKYFG